MDYAIWIEPDQAYLEERARRGGDRKDERWDGVLHMVPPPSAPHELGTYKLLVALVPAAERRGFVVLGATSAVFESADNYRIPDVTVGREEDFSDLGFKTAAVVVEVLSKNDMSRKKFGFYAKQGVRELWLIEPRTKAVEMYSLVDGAYLQVETLHSEALGITLEVGEKLRVIDGDRVVEI